MANYIGNEPRNLDGQRDYFAGTGSQTTFNLTYSTSGATGILVAISGVLQKAGISYFVSGKTLTFSEAPPIPPVGELSNIEVIYLQKLGSVKSANWRVPIASNTGTSNNITATYSPANLSLVNNLLLYVVLSTSNSASSPTFSPDGLPPKEIVDVTGSSLSVGSLKGTPLLRYDQAWDKWVCVNFNFGSNAKLYFLAQ